MADSKFDYGGTTRALYSDVKKYWWDAAPGEVWRRIEEMLKHFAHIQSYRSEEVMRFERMYGGRSLMGITPFSYWQTELPAFMDMARLKRNVVKSCIDALGAEIAQHKPRPQFLTRKGSERLKNVAKRRTRFADAMFYATDAYALMRMAFFDACRIGTGILKIYHDKHKIYVERVHPAEMFVVDAETMYGTTKQLTQIKYLARTEAAALPFVVNDPDKVDIVMQASSIDTSGTGAPGISDVIRVTECWRLPIKIGKKTIKEGRHVVTVDKGDLLDEVWDRETFPFAMYRYQNKALGFWGSGVAEMLLNIQFEINKLLRVSQEAFAFCSAPWVLTRNTGPQNKVNVAHLRNEAGAIINGGLGQVEVIAPAPVHPILVQQIASLVAAAYEECGISKSAATQVDDLGPDASGAARRERHDQYSRRFILQHQQYDEFALELTKRLMETAEDLAKYKKDLAYDLPTPGGTETISWLDTEPGEEMFLQCYPTNFFATTPEAKKQDVVDAIRNGWMSREQAMKQMDFPDLSSESALVTVYLDRVDHIAGIVLDGKMPKNLNDINGFWPDSFDLPQVDMMIDRMTRWMKIAQMDQEVNDDQLHVIQEWIERAVLLKQQAAPPPAPQMPAGPPGAPPPPMPEQPAEQAA